jgi:hypothetical protein
MFAHYYAVEGHFEALVREIDVCALVRMLFGMILDANVTGASKSSKKHSPF